MTNTTSTYSVKARGYYATSMPDGKLLVKGRGKRVIMTAAEFASILNAPKKRVKR